MLQVLGQQETASGFLGGSDDEGVPPGEAETVLYLPGRLQDMGVDAHRGPSEEIADIIARHVSGQSRSESPRYNLIVLLEDLNADSALPVRQRYSTHW